MRHQQLTDELQEKAILYAAGALDEDERREYERHLDEDNCTVCRGEVRESEAAAQSLTIMLPMQTPSESVKRRLIERAEAASLTGRSRQSAERSKPAFAWGGWLAAAAAAVLAAVFFNTNAGLREEVQSLNARVVELESQMTEQRTQSGNVFSGNDCDQSRGARVDATGASQNLLGRTGPAMGRYCGEPARGTQ